eukprot:2750596-Amphidinium_carterae.1
MEKCAGITCHKGSTLKCEPRTGCLQSTASIEPEMVSILSPNRSCCSRTNVRLKSRVAHVASVVQLCPKTMGLVSLLLLLHDASGGLSFVHFPQADDEFSTTFYNCMAKETASTINMQTASMLCLSNGANRG